MPRKSGKINVALTGKGTPLHVATELFQMMAGVTLVHVAYRGEPAAITDLISGQVQVLFGVLPSTLPYIRSGQLRALAVTTSKRQEVFAELAGDARIFARLRGERLVWHRRSPKDTPPEIVERLNQEVNAGLTDPKTKQRLVDLGCLFSEGRLPTSVDLSLAKSRSGPR